MRPSHPVVAALLDASMKGVERVRELVVPEVSGRVLEVGSGTGLNLPYYRGVDVVVGLEPDPHMLRRARTRVDGGGRVSLVAGLGEAMPFADDSFDAVLLTFTLCSVHDPLRVLVEVKRVLAPGGRLVWAEHVRARGRGARVAQGALTPLWQKIAGGCHLDRDAARLVTQAGLVDEGTFAKGRQTWTLVPISWGIATKR